MSVQHALLFSLLAVIVVLFAWGRWRYDVVAFGALIAATVIGAVPFSEMFSGFGHPATITVALVLVIGRGFRNSGAVDLMARHLLPALASPSRQVASMTAAAGALSTVMNNVGALALLMPVALQSAAKARHSPALILMPLSFGSILGGLVVLIGTPPNIIVAAFRENLVGRPFGMFDFTPVGGTVAVIGIAFIACVGWRLIPAARRAKLTSRELFDIENYVSEARAVRGSKAVGRLLSELDEIAAQHDAVILRLIRRKRRIDRPGRQQEVRAGDVAIIEAGAQGLDAVVSALDLRLPRGKKEGTTLFGKAETALMEMVVLPRSAVEGRTTEALHLRRRFAVNLLAVSRRGQPFRGRLRSFRLQAGDILLLEGEEERLRTVIASIGCLPLSSRSLVRGDTRQAALSVLVFAAAIAAAAGGWLSLPAALAVAAGVMVVVNIVPPRDIYESVDWPVVVLLGAMIPIGEALKQSGATEMLATGLVGLGAGWSPALLLAVVLVITMTLSDLINNAATAVVMAPIAAASAQGLGVSIDPFLMAVAIGASCAFLTPIGHQNNTLILGPGGYAFGDYWRMGLPLEILIVAVSVPMILWIWPL